MEEKTDTDLTTNWWVGGLERCFMTLRWEASRQLCAGRVKSWPKPIEPRQGWDLPGVLLAGWPLE